MKVSVVLITYNHEPFITQAIEGILAQETSFPVELLISEDCSTDGTRTIVEEYGRRHGDRIRLFLSPKNLCSNEVVTRALSAATGDYIALLDGDDYWTSPVKLQRQVDFLEAHPDCSLCFHNVRRQYDDGSESTLHNPPGQPAFTSVRQILQRCYIATCSALFRRKVLLPIPAWYDEMIWGDWPLFIAAAERGSLGYLPEVMATYRIHGGGFWSGMSEAKRQEQTIAFYRQIDRVTGYRHRHLIRLCIAKAYARIVVARLDAGDRRGASGAAVMAMMHDPSGHRVNRKEMLQGVAAPLRPLKRRIGSTTPPG